MQMENNQVVPTGLNNFPVTDLAPAIYLHQPFLTLSCKQYQCCNGSDSVVMRLLNWNDAAI